MHEVRKKRNQNHSQERRNEMRERQSQRIINYIDRFGSITPMEAFTDLGITKLATRVSEMRAKGIEFKKERITAKNRFGESVSFMRYSWKDEEKEEKDDYQDKI